MTTIEEHKIIVKDMEEDIKEDIKEKIKAKLLLRRQKIIGFAASEGSTNCFALFLHKKNLISSGFNVNHLLFTSEKKAQNKFPFDFPQKDKIIPLLVKQEDNRQKLCYGKNKDLSLVNDTVKNFFEIKNLIEAELGEKI